MTQAQATGWGVIEQGVETIVAQHLNALRHDIQQMLPVLVTQALALPTAAPATGVRQQAQQLASAMPKRRGRPPKSAQAAAPAPAEAPKKRGRPKKNPDAQAAAPAPAEAPKKRGRPSNASKQAAAAAPSANGEAPKKRGRPPGSKNKPKGSEAPAPVAAAAPAANGTPTSETYEALRARVVAARGAPASAN